MEHERKEVLAEHREMEAAHRVLEVKHRVLEVKHRAVVSERLIELRALLLAVPDLQKVVELQATIATQAKRIEELED